MLKNRYTIITAISALTIFILSIFLYKDFSFAADLSETLPSVIPGLPPGFQNIPSVIATIFNFVIIVAGTIFIILFLIGGVQYLTSAGNEEGTTKAKRLLVDAIVGLILTLAAWAIGIFILRQVGLLRSGIFGGPLPPVTTNPNPGPGGSGNPNGGGPVTSLQLLTKVTTADNQPIQNAEIYFDDVLIGKTLPNGLRTFAIDTGSHTVEVIHGQYRTISGQHITLTESNRSSQLVCMMYRDQDGSCQIQ